MLLTIGKYFGTKAELAGWTTGFFPPHETYYEACCGFAGVLLNKLRGGREIATDVYEPNINLLIQIRDRPAALVDRINQFLKQFDGPPSSLPLLAGRNDVLVRDVEKLREWVATYQPDAAIAHDPNTSPLDWAARYWLYSNLSFYGGGTRWNTGASTDPRKNLNPERLYLISRRLQRVEIRQQSCFSAISSLPEEALIYVDPPYVQSARKSRDTRAGKEALAPRRQYACDWTDEDHRQLASLLRDRVAIVAGYPSQLYDELFPDWTIATKQVDEAIECLWISPKASENLRQSQKQCKQTLLIP